VEKQALVQDFFEFVRFSINNRHSTIAQFLIIVVEEDFQCSLGL
jgi:hypothetical protein